MRHRAITMIAGLTHFIAEIDDWEKMMGLNATC